MLVAGIAWLGTAVPAGADNTNSNTNDNTNTDFGAYLGVDTGSEKTNWPPTADRLAAGRYRRRRGGRYRR